MIFTQNFYAADALHILTAIQWKCSAFITFDQNFQGNVGEIPIINQNTADFKHKLTMLMNQKKPN
jgi:hypothetical protein